MFRICLWAVLGAVAITPSKTGAQDDALSQDQLISRVLSANPSLEMAEEAARAAALRIEPAGALEDPTLSYALAPASLGDRALTTGHKVEVSQSFPWPGTRSLREEAARRRAGAVRAQVDLQRIRIVAAAKAAYAEWAFIHDAIRINKEHLGILQDLRASAASRYTAGKAGQADVLAADVELALVEDRDFVLEEQRRALQARLNSLMNQPPDTVLSAPPSDDQDLPPITLTALLSQAQKAHPELRGLNHQIAENRAEVRLAQKEFYPDIRVNGGYNSLWQESKLRPIVGLSINVPLNQSRRRAELAAARADVKRAQWRADDRRNEILENLTSTHAELDRAVKTYAHHKARLRPLAVLRLDAAEAAYTSGAGGFLDVIEAERQVLRIDLSLHRARADQFRKLAELELWAGGPIAED